MAILNVTHDALHKRLYGLPYLNQSQRDRLQDLILNLNAHQDWFPEAFHRTLKPLHEDGTFSEFEYKKILNEFFPGHGW